MKRALAIAVAVCTLGVAGFSQVGPITGTWTATVGLLPTVSLTSTLTLNYTVAGFVVTSVSGFGVAGLDAQRFGLRGAFGPFTITGNMWFDVLPAPAYSRADLVTSFDFGGIAIGATVRHWLRGEAPAAWGVPEPAPGQTAALQYILTTTVAPVEVRVRFLDLSLGTEFQDLRVRLTGLPFCCGITYGAELNFTKLGFSNLVLSGINIPLFAGVSFDVSITYGVTSKSVAFSPRLAGIGDICFAVWARPTTRDIRVWEGIQVDGFRVRCVLGDCNWIEYVHAFRPIDRAAATATIPVAIRDKFLDVLNEHEYLELGFCGAGCCGGRWEVTLRALWTTTPAAGVSAGIFGTTRFVGAVSIPIMTGFTASLGFNMPTVTLPAVAVPDPFAAARPAFTFGWTFTF